MRRGERERERDGERLFSFRSSRREPPLRRCLRSSSESESEPDESEESEDEESLLEEPESESDEELESLSLEDVDESDSDEDVSESDELDESEGRAGAIFFNFSLGRNSSGTSLGSMNLRLVGFFSICVRVGRET